ncbi:geranyl transferase [Bordetella genomosp. 1]|uniref:Geranyl transferase n=1 Tax=Bordetella genomosp. 1 TaxID=1395607 RepID=A0A261S788_9BORD|nr:farnesyl diphosphate synthase [Bordetella genomosp. 1]MDQ8033800.1 polyprenyl synthetase family protein [Bordetella sp.]OZI32847.1 geranyl transferase [Bordetella genomosp. 1]OZI65802.1 geranyl transferase [Bordetella genomosp. 1]
MKQNHLAFADWLSDRAQHIEHVLDELLPGPDVLPARLHEAMRYAVLGGGKRVRAALVYAAGQACPVAGSAVAVSASLDHAAAAVELIHAYSLVHDDLPCMDDDTLRRGRPTTHVQFDEATAMLAGDALQPLAFELLGRMPIAPALVVQAVQALARAAGSQGMAGGQAIDLLSVGTVLARDELQTMHSMKTGAMLAASVALGGIVAGASSQARQALDAYAQSIGLAFQVVDDILDVTADSAALGKTPGKDADDNKPTYVSLLGLEGARAFAEELRQSALQALGPLGDSGARLAQLADFIVLRDR